MSSYRYLKRALLGLLVLTSSMSQVAAAAPDAPAAAPSQGMARVWFLRPSSSENAAVWGADPMIYANRAPIATIPRNSFFYRDVTAGTYSFTVQPYGVPTGAADTVGLAPGSQTYFEVQWVTTWDEGYPSGGRGDEAHSFFVLNMSPQLAQAYLPSLRDLGQR